MKKFFKHQPADRGRVKITIETDMVVVREFWQLIGDLPEALSKRAKYVPKAVIAIQRAFADLEKLL